MLFDDVYPYSKNLNVLYVEDSSTLRKAMAKKLAALFKRLDIAEDGTEAMECYKNYHKEHGVYYDIVISDLEMPNMDGRQLVKRIMDFKPSQDVIVISGSNDFGRVVELINVGVRKFVSKPVEEGQLYDVISDTAQHIRRKRMEEQEQAELSSHNAILRQREKVYFHKLEKSIKELSEFSEALDASAIVAKTDVNGVIVYVNDKFCKISGYSEEELLGQTHSIVNSGRMSKSFFMRLWHTITAKRNYRTTFQNRAKDGSIYYVETYIKPILDLEGRIVEFIAVSHDMTQQIELLKNEQRVRKSKEEFFINISHEMRTPLNAILGFASLLKKRLKEDEQAYGMLEALYGGAEELSQLIESMLDIRKIKDKCLDIKETVFHPLAPLEACIEKYAEKARLKEQECRSVIDPGLPAVLVGDCVRVTQMLGAVLDNAVKFTPKNGLVETTVFYDTPGEKLVCLVKDSGIGIALQDQKKIFDLHQASASLDRSHEGVGLGLSIVSEIIKLMHGSITLESEPGKGSLFRLEIPLRRG